MYAIFLLTLLILFGQGDAWMQDAPSATPTPTTTKSPTPTKPTDAPTPTAKPTNSPVPVACSSFSSLSPLSCPNVQQFTNGVAKERINVLTSWCTSTQNQPGTTCKYPGYVFLESDDGTSCHRVFNQWGSGVKYDTTSQTAEYTVQGEQDTVIVIIKCDSNGTLNTAKCPDSIVKTGTPTTPRTYTLVYKSKNACAGSPTPTPTSGPNCSSWMSTPLNCPNVPHFKDGNFLAMSTFYSSWCQLSKTPSCYKPSYATIMDNGKCTMPYDTWVSGPQVSELSTSYTVRNAYASSNNANMTVSVVCDKTMTKGKVGCPDSILTNNGHTDVIVRSQSACPTPNCNITSTIGFSNFSPISCSNVAIFQGGVPVGIYTITVYWCQQALFYCPGSYIYFSNTTTICAQQFPSWKKGIQYNSTGRFAQYVVEDSSMNEVVVSLYCNPNSQYVCPTQITAIPNTGKQTTKYEFAIGTNQLCH